MKKENEKTNFRGFVEKIGAIFSKSDNKRESSTAVTEADIFAEMSGGGAQTAAGAFVNEKSAMKNATVFACGDRLCQTVSVLPLHLYRRKNGKTEIADQHPVNWVLQHEPNPEMVPSTFKKTNMLHRVFWGNGYAWIRRDNAYRVRELYPLPPESTVVWRNSNGDIKYTSTIENRRVTLDSSEVLHIPGLSLDGLVGKSVIGLHREAIGLAVAAEEYGARYFLNGANIKGVLESQKELEPEQIERLRKGFQRLYAGNRNAHSVAVLEEGMKYVTLSIPNDDAQFIETRTYQKEEICGIFGVPPILIQANDKVSSWGTGIEQIMTAFVRTTILPYLVAFEEAVKQKLLSREERLEYYPKFTVEGLLRGDYKTRMSGYSLGRINGMYSINEIRRMEDMDPIENGDGHLVQANYNELGAVKNEDDETKH